jgi:anti-sigma B factor antagonist
MWKRVTRLNVWRISVSSDLILGYCGHAMAPTALELEKVAGSDGDRAILRLKGKLSLETVPSFLQTVRAEPAARLVLDMSGVLFLDSAGVGALVQVYVHRRNKGQTFALAGLTTQSNAIIQVAGLRKLFQTYGSVEEALAGENA